MFKLYKVLSTPIFLQQRDGGEIVIVDEYMDTFGRGIDLYNLVIYMRCLHLPYYNL